MGTVAGAAGAGGSWCPRKCRFFKTLWEKYLRRRTGYAHHVLLLPSPYPRPVTTARANFHRFQFPERDEDPALRHHHRRCSDMKPRLSRRKTCRRVRGRPTDGRTDRQPSRRALASGSQTDGDGDESRSSRRRRDVMAASALIAEIDTLIPAEIATPRDLQEGREGRGRYCTEGRGGEG